MMSNPFDNLFSLEKLRQNWVREKSADVFQAVEGVRPLAGSGDARGEMVRVREVIRTRYRLEVAQVLEFMLDELEGLLCLRFPETPSLPEAELTVLNPAMEQALNSIEDLVEALELARLQP